LHTLPRLLDSILVQSFKDLEVLLVDDCSDEPCGPVVQTYRGKGLEIVLLEHGERIYTMQARLTGIAAARGKIIGFADADDILWGKEELKKKCCAVFAGKTGYPPLQKRSHPCGRQLPRFQPQG
jgi:hypothetical protein